MTLKLTNLEAGWIVRNIVKFVTILDANGKRDPGVYERKPYKVLTGVLKELSRIEKILEMNPTSVEVELVRSQRQMICAVVERMINSLVDKTIPRYESKSLTEYAEACKIKVEMLKGLRRKLQ